ncbi:guanylate kinase [Pseudochelatococcus contaminans]|uniref:Guanylate kinase n=1 Tax=Pseudochelatococcus contaminans TaxID=1538103 RepID=A0A7W6EI65_9HYPH|nr:guanylate kinase [Pseudochelatococcus contaminans]MBB3810829.1 guanylate kinase [Pseudochelatococcus contaminans]
MTVDSKIQRRGLMLILSSPSGAGKTTLTRDLIQLGDLSLSVSITTRPRRASEIDGVHYHFIGRDEFIFQRDRGDLLEWAEVHGNFYGTPRKPVLNTLASGRDMVFDVDWQGTLQILEHMRDDAVTVFILPPSLTELRTRLERRAEDAQEIINRRLLNARDEISHWDAYDYVIVNDDLDHAFKALLSILAAERLKRVRRDGLARFVDGLLAEDA